MPLWGLRLRRRPRRWRRMFLAGGTRDRPPASGAERVSMFQRCSRAPGQCAVERRACAEPPPNRCFAAQVGCTAKVTREIGAIRRMFALLTWGLRGVWSRGYIPERTVDLTGVEVVSSAAVTSAWHWRRTSRAERARACGARAGLRRAGGNAHVRSGARARMRLVSVCGGRVARGYALRAAHGPAARVYGSCACIGPPRSLFRGPVRVHRSIRAAKR